MNVAGRPALAEPLAPRAAALRALSAAPVVSLSAAVVLALGLTACERSRGGSAEATGSADAAPSASASAAPRGGLVAVLCSAECTCGAASAPGYRGEDGERCLVVGRDDAAGIDRCRDRCDAAVTERIAVTCARLDLAGGSRCAPCTCALEK